MAGAGTTCGGLWLAEAFKAEPFGDLAVRSYIGTNRRTTDLGPYVTEIYPPQMYPGDEAADHLQFHIRHEPINLELLSRVFNVAGPRFVQKWVNSKPTSQYSRRAAFLYEFLTDEDLLQPSGLRGSYIPVLDKDKNLSAIAIKTEDRISKWKVINNMPGTRFFCPAIPLSERLMGAFNYDISRHYDEIVEEFGAELLSRSASWLTTRESRASFAIEKESGETNRIQRFAQVIATWTGHDRPPSHGGDTPDGRKPGASILSEQRLASLQQAILGDAALLPSCGYRKSPVFVGRTSHHSQVVHYLAPPAEDVAVMLEGIETFLERTQYQSPVMRAAIASFGFVYVHPLIDGNGRVHRFLINDILRRDGATPDDVILPVSVAINDDPTSRRAYDEVLDKISVPLMNQIRPHISFASKPTTYPDGMESDLVFSEDGLARPNWRYANYAPHVIYMAEVINTTIVHHMRDEAVYLRNHDNARQALKEICEMPDGLADSIIRSVTGNDEDSVGRRLRRNHSQVTDEMWASFVQAVRDAFAPKR
ncbi:Fic family protein [Gluconacetobacter sp. 1c LMG 22058]|uniref:Fic family protein n=1 Tax=Gluconacetobacter dulcium TaxID=2729096 RepID=A0A7W4K3C3_9PROT|nr:Fic family protein [Gluconacetobacter dulcium]MBB2199485.1 Fic family protein [Gluconacetobacter dulcium]